MSIRYLPPGLKEFELTNILGDDWRVGGGKVDWMCFEPGKQARTYVPILLVSGCRFLGTSKYPN